MCGCRKANGLRVRKAWEHIALDGTITEYPTTGEASAARDAHGGSVRRIVVRELTPALP